MPSDNKVKHPINESINITFTQDDHSYNDNRGKKYISVTTLISKAFPEFDKETVAQKCAIKRGTTKEILLAEWQKKAKQATRLGTRLHYNMEHYILNQLDKLYSPQNLIEKIKFDSGKKMVEKIKEIYHPLSMEPEKLVFSPTFGIAGSIDLLVKLSQNEYIIFDWKCLSKDLQEHSFKNKCGHILPTLYIQDCNFFHYSLQLQIYENILKSEQYIPINANVKRILIVWNGNHWKFQELPNLSQSWALMCWAHKFLEKKDILINQNIDI